MKKISSLEALGGVLSPFTGRGCYANNPLPPTSHKPALDGGRLYHIPLSGGVLLLEDMQSCLRVYLHTGDLTSPLPQVPGRALVAELVYKSGAQKHQAVLDYLLGQGFESVVTRHCLLCPSGSFIPASGTTAPVLPAESGDMDAVQRLLTGNFHPLAGALPDDGELRACISREEVLCTRDDEGGITGIIHVGIESQRNKLLHLAVSRNSRNRGLGRSLLEGWRQMTSPNGLPYTIWVADSNAPAQHLYLSLGFTRRGVGSHTLVRQD